MTGVKTAQFRWRLSIKQNEDGFLLGLLPLNSGIAQSLAAEINGLNLKGIDKRRPTKIAKKRMSTTMLLEIGCLSTKSFRKFLSATDAGKNHW
jgi:hypothetical protein